MATKKTKATKKVIRKTATKAAKKAKKPVRAAKTTGTVKKATKKAIGAKITKATKTTSQQKRKKFKTHLNKKQLRKFREILLEKSRSLVGDMMGIENSSLGRNLQDSAGDLSNMPTHMADIGSDNFEHEFTLGLLESEHALMQEINDALERVDNASYGVCLGTGKPIGNARLTARPWCKYGIEYQRMIEKGLVRPGEEDEKEIEAPDDEMSRTSSKKTRGRNKG